MCSSDLWTEERALLRPIPERILASLAGEGGPEIVHPAVSGDPRANRGPERPAEPRSRAGWYQSPDGMGTLGAVAALRSTGDRVEIPELLDYEAVLA